jgi:hypothetical protein
MTANDVFDVIDLNKILGIRQKDPEEVPGAPVSGTQSENRIGTHVCTATRTIGKQKTSFMSHS